VGAGKSNIQSTAGGKKTHSSFGSILLQVRTHFARPNWKEVFNKIASKHPFGTVGKESIQINKTPFSCNDQITVENTRHRSSAIFW
jgi:hypothetical protein